jgi:hypothetical protein
VELGKDPELWSVSRELQMMALQVISANITERSLLREYVRAILANRLDDFPTTPEWMLAALDILDPAMIENVPARLAQALGANSTIVGQWIEEIHSPDSLLGRRFTTVSFVVDLLRPTDAHLTPSQISVLCAVLEQARDQSDFRIASFLLRRGLGLRTNASPELISTSFQLVFDAISFGFEDQDLWRSVEPFVAERTNWWYRSDDRPYRLCKTVVQRFANEEWDVYWFLRCFKNVTTFEMAVGILEESSRGRRYKRRIRDTFRDDSHLDLTDVLAGVASLVRQWW